jgi:hypothetical protein
VVRESTEIQVTNCALYQSRVLAKKYGAFGEMRVGRGNRDVRRNSDKAPIESTTNPTLIDQALNPDTAVRSGLKTAFATARPFLYTWIYYPRIWLGDVQKYTKRHTKESMHELPG